LLWLLRRKYFHGALSFFAKLDGISVYVQVDVPVHRFSLISWAFSRTKSRLAARWAKACPTLSRSTLFTLCFTSSGNGRLMTMPLRVTESLFHSPRIRRDL